MIEKRIFLTATQGDWRRFAGGGIYSCFLKSSLVAGKSTV
jgi:hypothetical protein